MAGDCKFKDYVYNNNIIVMMKLPCHVNFNNCVYESFYF